MQPNKSDSRAKGMKLDVVKSLTYPWRYSNFKNVNLHEYQAKQIFAQYSIPIAKGKLVTSSQEAFDAFKSLGVTRCAIKAQVHAGGRGKAGGIRVVTSADEAKAVASQLLNKPLVTHQTGPQGRMVRKLLLEEALEINREIYIGITLDRRNISPTIMMCKEGGVEIEEVVKKNLQAIITEKIDIFLGLKSYQARKLAAVLELKGPLFNTFCAIATALSRLYIEKNLSLVEINPLIVTKDEHIIALDAKIVLDDRALKLHPDLEAMRDIEQEDRLESEAGKNGLSYVSMDGTIGCMVNGAGLAMSTMDIIKLHGGRPANFLDVGGGANKDQIVVAFKLLLSNPAVKAVLINIFGGILRCDVLAQGIVEAAREIKPKVPIVVRLEGTRVEEGRKILAESGLAITTATDMADAAQKVVKLANEYNCK